MSAKYSKNLDIEQGVSDQDDLQRIEHSRRQWSFLNWSKKPSATIPLRAKKTEYSLNDQATLLRHHALNSLFGLSAAHISEWDGLLVFLYHLESYFTKLLDSRFDPIWMLLGRHTPSTSVEVWHWCFAVIGAYDSLRDQDPSIESIYKRLWETTHPRTVDGSVKLLPNEGKEYTLQAIFAVLCWTSATLKPLVGEEATKQLRCISNSDASDEEATFSLPSTVLFAENCSTVYWANDLRRPTSKMFHSYQLQPDDASHQETGRSNILSSGNFTQSGYNFEDMLYVSSLNYGSLSMIGRVRIKWVDTLTSHLDFDRATRELSIYRYPSFCATKILSKHKVKVLESITESLLPSQYFTHSSKEPVSIYREVLLSYRLLFGQSQNSREILRQILKRSTSDTTADHPKTGDSAMKNEIDSFLETLCTSALHSGPHFLGLCLSKNPRPRLRGDLFPPSALNMDDELIESDTYSARDDFPVFGPRLLAVQRYNMRRQPSRVLDLWRDRRNPLQWYTFWAVLWVGGASIILGVMQLAVSVLQTAYTIHPAT